MSVDPSCSLPKDTDKVLRPNECCGWRSGVWSLVLQYSDMNGGWSCMCGLQTLLTAPATAASNTQCLLVTLNLHTPTFLDHPIDNKSGLIFIYNILK